MMPFTTPQLKTKTMKNIKKIIFFSLAEISAKKKRFTRPRIFGVFDVFWLRPEGPNIKTISKICQKCVFRVR